MKKFLVALIIAVLANVVSTNISNSPQPTTQNTSMVIIDTSPPVQSPSTGNTALAIVLIIVGIIFIGGEICLCGACLGYSAGIGFVLIIFGILGCIVA